MGARDTTILMLCLAPAGLVGCAHADARPTAPLEAAKLVMPALPDVPPPRDEAPVSPSEGAIAARGPTEPRGGEQGSGEPRERRGVVTFDPEGPGPAAEPRLGEASRREKERRGLDDEVGLTITNENLAEHAVGPLTYTDRPASGTAAEESSRSDEELAAAARILGDEAYWRNRVRSIRQEWADAVEEILDLEERVEELRRSFYAEDDPYVRDGRIKPRWDRALLGLEEARRRAGEMERELASALEEGTRAGALPGWLRDGTDLEPTERPYLSGPDRGDPAVLEVQDVQEVDG